MTGALLNVTPQADPRSEAFDAQREPFTFRLVEERGADVIAAPVARRGGFGAALLASGLGAGFKLLAFGVAFLAMIFRTVAGVVMWLSLLIAAGIVILSMFSGIWAWLHLGVLIGFAFGLFVAIGLVTLLEDHLKRASKLVS